jgi:2-C-methyl-D-erythritol 4-phosphate cytidylyltransferase
MKISFKEKIKRKQNKPGLVSAVIVAAGSSSRMGGGDKLAMPLAGSTVISRTIRAFQDCPEVGEIVLVLRKGAEKSALGGASGCDKLARIVHGGESRTASAYAGVTACDRTSEIILIHDGARPLVTAEVIQNAIKGAREFGAAVPVTPVTDTIKVGKGGFADSTPERASLFAAQTPQAFRAELIKAALKDAVDQGLALTDDCAAVERLGMRVKLVEGDARNRKITLPSDLALAEALWKEMHP